MRTHQLNAWAGPDGRLLLPVIIPRQLSHSLTTLWNSRVRRWHKSLPETSYCRGEDNGNALLDEARVLEIRSRYATSPAPYSQLSKEYGIAASTVRAVVNRKSWKHVP